MFWAPYKMLPHNQQPRITLPDYQASGITKTIRLLQSPGRNPTILKYGVWWGGTFSSVSVNTSIDKHGCHDSNLGLSTSGPLFTKRTNVCTTRSREVSKPRDLGLIFSSHSEIWQAPQQQHCRNVCQIAERYDHYNIESRGFETSRDLVVRRPSAMRMEAKHRSKRRRPSYHQAVWW